MDINTRNNRSEAEKEEIKLFGTDFTKQVMNSNVSDGRGFWMNYEVRIDKDNYCIFEKYTNKQFGTYKSKSEKVMNTLMTDAV